MNDIEIIRKTLEMHRFRPKGTEYHEKCSGCAWIGWNHDQHVAEAIDEAIRLNRTLTTIDQVRALGTGHEMAGPLIKCLGVVNPESGAYGMGEVYEANSDGTWGLLASAGGESKAWLDRDLNPEDLPLPATLLWTP